MTPLAQAFIDRPIAHRGFHDRRQRRPENSTGAALLAVTMGYGVEIDVQLTADGEAVVFHDATLDRMTGETGPVRDRTARELSTIALDGGDRDTETIPTLAAFLGLVGGRTPVLIELKDQTGNLGETDGRLETAVARVLSEVDDPPAHAVMSFNPHMIAAMAGLAPGIARGLVTDPFLADAWPGVPPARLESLRDIADYDRVGASFVSHNATDLESTAIARLKDRGAAILCWTIRSPEAERTARRIAHNVTFEGYSPEVAGA